MRQNFFHAFFPYPYSYHIHPFYPYIDSDVKSPNHIK